MDLDQALQTFISESRELLVEMESALLAVEQAEDKDELINAIFRAAHTMKGSASLSAWTTSWASRTAWKACWTRCAPASWPSRPIWWACCWDAATTCGSRGCRGQRTDRTRARTDPAGCAPDRTAAQAPAARPQPREWAPSCRWTSRPRWHGTIDRVANTAATDYWHLSLRFGPDVLRNGMDPLSFIRYLETLGRIVDMVTFGDAIPIDGSMDPEACYLGYEIALDTQADKKTLENVFEFVQDDCQLRILPPHSRIAEYVGLLMQDNEPARLGDMLRRCGTLTARELDAALGKR